MLKNRDLRGKVVFITGASMGIGRETAFMFAREGCSLIVTYNTHKEDCMKLREKCLSLGAKDVLVLKLNLMDNSSIKNAVRETVDKYGHIDILINNAGVIAWKSLKNQSYEDIEHQVRTNLEGLIKITKELLPRIRHMIINVSSAAGKDGIELLTTYCATKFGVRGFTQALAEEIPSIQVYSVNPDMTATQMTNFAGRPPEDVAKVILNTAKGKYRVRSGGDVDVWKVI